LLGTHLDAHRLVLPEYDAGSLDRIFSAVTYKDDTDNTIPQHAPGSVWGAAALVVGTTMGAGVLALPATTVSIAVATINNSTNDARF